MKYTQKTKYFVFGALATAVLAPLAIYAVETIPITFSEGDVISASVMNAVFDRINNISRQPTASMLLGTWNCSETIDGSGGFGNYTADASGLFGTRANVYTFVAGATTNALKLSTTTGYPLRTDATAWSNVSVAIAPNTRLLLASVNRDSYAITSIGNDRFDLSETAQGNAGTCVKANIAPAPADALTATVSGTSVALAWTDQNSDETGFKVQYKTSVSGTWTTATTTAADATSYTFSGLTAGTYWFRVVATSGNGDAMSSSEVQGVIQ